jgi:catechol 2,3-dioxygenase-like lactoylglutathione lyase family enzyme
MNAGNATAARAAGDRSGFTYSPSLNHVAVTVPDLGAAVDWYTSVLGFEVLHGPVEFGLHGAGEGASLPDVFGERFRKMRICWLATGGQTGIELFELVDPPTEISPSFEYWRTGLMHLALTVGDVDAVVARIDATGGQRASKTWEWYEDHHYAYCRDPWGTVIELTDMSYDRINANRA